MIFRHTPVTGKFPDFSLAEALLEPVISLPQISPVFYDIETTGLSRRSASLYLIGAVAREDEQWILFQWFAEHPGEEPEILEAFRHFLSGYNCTVQYNGDRFDQPFLAECFRRYEMDSPLNSLPSCDLYQKLKPCKNLFSLAAMKQPDLEHFLGLPERSCPDGGEGIRIYRNYVKRPDPEAAELLMGHNQEDLLGLGAILPLLGYLCLFRGDFTVEQSELDENCILFLLTLPVKLPAEASIGKNGVYLTASQNHARLMLPLTSGRLKRYYANYKDYDYLPSEDTAIPKSLSTYMDKSLRQAARPETCYTWFTPGDAFLKDPAVQTTYLKQTLPLLLKLVC